MTGDFNGDRRQILGWFARGGVAVTAAGAVAVPNRGAADETIKLDDVPATVRKAADEYIDAHFKLKVVWAPDVVKMEEDNNAKGKKNKKKFAYEFDGARGKGLELTLVVTEEGKVIEVEKQLKDTTKVPADALAAVTKRWPNFAATTAYEILQGSDLSNPKVARDTVYDLRGNVGKKGGRDFHVQVSEKGDITEWTIEVQLANVPAAVTNALKERRPNFTVVTAFALHEPKEIIGYHFEGTLPKGKEITVSVSPDGKHVEAVE